MRKPKASVLRALSALLVIAIVIVGLIFPTGLGTATSFGLSQIATLCPLGAIEVAIARHIIVPPMLIGFAVVVVVTLLLGRVFCAWGCPVPLLRRLIGKEEFDRPKKRKRRKGAQQEEDGDAAQGASDTFVACAPADASACEGKGRKRFSLAIPASKRGGVQDSRNWVLGGAIVSTAIFGFPVFCIICPVGLTFGTIIVLWRLIHFAELSWSLLVFPAVLAVELVVMRKWCHRFCPVGALFSLIARGNRTFRPKSNAASCLKSDGTACDKCAQVCPEGIDLHDAQASTPLNECIKCRSCADACPVHAISFPFLPGKAPSKGASTKTNGTDPAPAPDTKDQDDTERKEQR